MKIKTEYKLLLSVFLIELGNIAIYVTDEALLRNLITSIIIFIVFAALLIINGVYGNDKILSIGIFILSLCALWFSGYKDPTGVFIFLMAYHAIKDSYRIVILYVLLFGLCLISKYIYLGLQIPQLLTFMAGTSLYIILFLHFMPDKEKCNDTKAPIVPEVEGISQEVVEIMKLRMLDLDWPEIKDRMEFDKQPSSIVSEISRARGRANIINQEAFVILILLGLKRNGQLSEILGEYE
ncbi:MAG: hypothetical protein JRJ00_00310 [Deltaproteobacteria bacterium]|nr:hypothetical protein [Deltaproteobacteria bacterium]